MSEVLCRWWWAIYLVGALVTSVPAYLMAEHDNGYPPDEAPQFFQIGLLIVLWPSVWLAVVFVCVFILPLIALGELVTAILNKVRYG